MMIDAENERSTWTRSGLDPAFSLTGHKVGSRGFAQKFPQKFWWLFSMFSHLASRCLRPCSRPSRIHPVRNFSSTIQTRSDLSPEPPTDAEVALEAALTEQEATSGEQDSAADAEATADPETYNDFMDMIGFQFKHADGPRKWLGGQVVEFVFTSSCAAHSSRWHYPLPFFSHFPWIHPSNLHLQCPTLSDHIFTRSLWRTQRKTMSEHYLSDIISVWNVSTLYFD